MNAATRFTIIAACFLLCAGGIIVAHSSSERSSKIDNDCEEFGMIDLAGDYQYAASETKLSFKQLESIIRHDGSAMSQQARIEFGSVKMERGTALVQVLFFAPDGRMQPFLYKVVPEKNSWKIVSAQRMWFVPRSHLLRGLRV
jgi:hypothetical protein